MGKIKQKMIKKSAKILLKEDLGFGKDFEKNKEILKKDIVDKKIRNKIAGYLVQLVKQQESS